MTPTSLLDAPTPTELGASGFALLPNAVSAAQRETLFRLLQGSPRSRTVRHRTGQVFAARGLLWDLPHIRTALRDCGLDVVASQLLGRPAFPIDALFFDKHPDANWTVPAHQDRMMPVQAGSSVRLRQRYGLTYAEPSVRTLAALLALRLHFDDADPDSGALRLVPGSHLLGVLPSDSLRDVPLDSFVPTCASAGDILLVRPLTLHRSAESRRPRRRRILHVVYATEQPDDDLTWRITA